MGAIKKKIVRIIAYVIGVALLKMYIKRKLEQFECPFCKGFEKCDCDGKCC